MSWVLAAIVEDGVTWGDLLQIVIAATGGSAVAAGVAERRLHVESRVSMLEAVVATRRRVIHNRSREGRRHPLRECAASYVGLTGTIQDSARVLPYVDRVAWRRYARNGSAPLKDARNGSLSEAQVGQLLPKAEAALDELENHLVRMIRVGPLNRLARLFPNLGLRFAGVWYAVDERLKRLRKRTP